MGLSINTEGGCFSCPLAFLCVAYCLIIGTPPNAIAYASGFLQPRDFVRAGLPLWFVAQILLLLMVAFYWIPMGFGTMARF
jgi:sodium-dependent dicarboxylate transporter 2/3/5